jgi:formylglycine-generating enzyme required for sulfatase activity
LKDVSYALAKSTWSNKIKDATWWYKKIEKGENLSLKEDFLNGIIWLKLKFKVLKSEKESFCLKTTLSLEQQTIHVVTTNLILDNDPVAKEKILHLGIPINQLKKGIDSYLLELKTDSQMLFSTKVVVDNSIEFNVHGVKFKMIKIDAGTFEMGAPNNDIEAGEIEKPQHKVELDEFYIGETVVTQALWKAVVRKSRIVSGNFLSMPGMKENPSHFKGDDLPVEMVSFHCATIFIEKLNELLKDQLHGKKFALPSEEQWEFAARGGGKSKNYKYSGSNCIDEVAWYDGNSGSRTHPVKEKLPNELGIYDMDGNVSEWCDNWWRVNYLDNAYFDINQRVIRGGSWGSGLLAHRLTYRSNLVSSYSGSWVGFRLILQ